MGEGLGRFWYAFKQVVLHLLAALGLWVVLGYVVLGLFGWWLPDEWCKTALPWVWLAVVLGYLLWVLIRYGRYRRSRQT